MTLVTRDHLERWASTTLSKSTLPYLVSRLARATTPASTKINLPSGSATYIGGWDGIVNCEIETSYVPQGISLWEFGTSSDCKGKADSDYDKRKKNPIGFIPSNSIFVFVTPRLWTRKNEWIAAKKAENYWKDVIVYDSVDLEQWLDSAPVVSRWFASQDGVGAYPYDGIMTADEFWEEWSIGPKGLVLLPESVVAGRECQKELLLSALRGEPAIKGIKASTKNEALAFIIASIYLLPPEEADIFLSKILIVDTERNFRGIRINTNTALNLIPRFDDAQPLSSALAKGHHVLVPLGADDIFNQEIIDLPTIDRDGLVDSLIKSGQSRENAEKFSRESARNITILKKLLGFPQYKAKWYNRENIREIIPALLLGRWNEKFSGDVELIEKLSGQKYADYLVTLNKWKNFEESPIIQIGETWRLTSPLDSWTNLACQLTRNDFENLQECFSLAFKNGNQSIESEGRNGFLSYFNKTKKYSNWSREGLTQSLILVGRLSRVLPNLDSPQDWVDNIIFDLLKDASGEKWISIYHELPLIAEASPETFLKAVKQSIENPQPEIMDMFREEDDFPSKKSHHSGLLWALEGLAWLPEYLRDVSLILLKLSGIDPGGSLSNRPINSIAEIFKPWHYQTLAPYEERMEILRYITEKEKESGWSLLIRMLPSHNDFAYSTHKMRWRMFDKNTNLSYTYKETRDTHSAVIEMLIALFDKNEEKFSQLIKETPNLSPSDRKRVLDWADEVCPNIRQEKFSTWEIIREILNHHRSHPDTDWALPESELEQLENLYNKLQPTDIIHKYIWLFNEHWPKFQEGFKYEPNEYKKGYKQRQKRIEEARKKAVTDFIQELGLEATLELRKRVKDPGLLGEALASVITKQEDILLVCECLYDDNNLIGFAQNFFCRKSIIEKFDWIKSLFSELQEKRFSNKVLSNLLIPLDQKQQLWNFVSSLDEEIRNEYWQNINPCFFHMTDAEKAIGIEMLLKHKRFFSAIDVTWHFADVIPSNLLLEMLKKAPTEEACETPHFRGYEIERIFEELDKRMDIERSSLFELECLYIPILSTGTKRGLRVLEEELANNPEFFIDVLKWLYKPKDEGLLEKEQGNLSNEAIQNGARRAYHLLRSWKKIPGMRDDNSIDELELKNWIIKARALAETVSRLDVADEEIGKLLGQYPEDCVLWPQEKIFQIIEDINTDDLKSGYSMAMLSKGDVSIRGAFDGGGIERDKAEYFEKLENDFKYKYPNVAEVFKFLKQRYLAYAKRMDEQAERDKLEY